MANLLQSGIKAPQFITDVNIIMDGEGFLGSSSSVTLPAIEKEVEEHQVGMMVMHIDKGLYKAMKLSFTIERYAPVGLAWAGIERLDGQKTITMKGSIKDSQKQIPAIAIFRGIMTKTEEPSFTKQQKVERKFELGINFYSLAIDGRPYYVFDAQNMVATIDEVDMLDTVRDQLLA